MKSTFIIVLFYLFTLSGVSYGFNYDFQIENDKFREAGLPAGFDEVLRTYANKLFLDEASTGTLTLQRLIQRTVKLDWYPKIDIYFENAGLIRADINIIRDTRLSELMQHMPRYNLTDFWDLPFKVLVNGLKFYMSSAGTKDMLLLLKDVYKTQADADQKIDAFAVNDSVAYMSNDRANVFELVKTLQSEETRSLMSSFDLNDNKLTLVTQDSFQTVNTKFSQLIFASIHQDETIIKSSKETLHEVLKRLQLYRESFYTWSQTCARSDGTIPTTPFGQQNLQEITKRCFSQSFSKLSNDLYNVQVVNEGLFEKLPIADIYLLLNQQCCNTTALFNASTLIGSSVERIKTFEDEKKQSFITLALNKTNQSLADIQSKTLHHLLPIIHNMELSLILKLYGVSMNTEARIDINHIPFTNLVVKLNDRAGNVSYSLQQWRIVSMTTIIDALNRQLNKIQIEEKVRSAILEFGEHKIGALQNFFPVDSLSTLTLYMLAYNYFGLTQTEFFDFYKIQSNQQNFFLTALLSDIVSLGAPQANVELFSIKELVSVVQRDFIYADVMMARISSLKGNHTSAFFKGLSVPQMVDDYSTNDNITAESFRDYVLRWSGSNELVDILETQSFEQLIGIIHKTVDGVNDDRLLNLLNQVLETFGVPCNPTISKFCKAQQKCVADDIDPTKGKCECNTGYRFVAKDKCEDIDECKFAQVTCHTEATCYNSVGSYDCRCNAGYQGDGINCYDINECFQGIDNCDINAECYNTQGAFACICRSGFLGNGMLCSNVDECLAGTHDCHVNSTCFDVLGTYICNCNNGFSGNGKICEDVNECENPNTCKRYSTCRNTIGSYNCDCIETYIHKDGGCYECLLDQLQNCAKDAECLNSRCICKTGYQKAPYDNSQCVDINECHTTSDICGYGYCENIKGSYKCICDTGFQHNIENNDKTKCVDINECNVALSYGKTLCPNKYQHCKNEFGSYACITERPNTELRIALGSAIPLVIILAALMFTMYFLHRRTKGKRELTSFDNRLKAMYVNRAYEGDTKSDVVSIISRNEDNRSTSGILPNSSSTASPYTASQNDDKLKRNGSLTNFYKKQNLRNMFKKT